MTALLTTRDATARLASPSLVVYGDFACPWSYLASRRAAVLEAAGYSVDWRAVEAGERRPWLPDVRQQRLASVRAQMPDVLAALLDEEHLPYALAGSVPFTRAATSAYAEAYAAGVASSVGRLLFRAFWMHGFDLDDANSLRTLLIDQLLDSHSPSHVVSEWGMVPDVTGAPVSTAAWRLTHDWRAAWKHEGRACTPVVEGGGQVRRGAQAVAWLGTLITDRRLAPDPATYTPPLPTPDQDAPDLSWVSQNGGRWLHAASKCRTHRPWNDAER